MVLIVVASARRPLWGKIFSRSEKAVRIPSTPLPLVEFEPERRGRPREQGLCVGEGARPCRPDSAFCRRRWRRSGRGWLAACARGRHRCRAPTRSAPGSRFPTRPRPFAGGGKRGRRRPERRSAWRGLRPRAQPVGAGIDDRAMWSVRKVFAVPPRRHRTPSRAAASARSSARGLKTARNSRRARGRQPRRRPWPRGASVS